MYTQFVTNELVGILKEWVALILILTHTHMILQTKGLSKYISNFKSIKFLSLTLLTKVIYSKHLRYLYSRFRSPYKPTNEMQLLEGKFATSTEKKDSFENIDHRGSKIVSPKSRNVGNSPGFYDENEQNLMDSFNGTRYLNDSHGSGESFPRNHSRRETPESYAGSILDLPRL